MSELNPQPLPPGEAIRIRASNDVLWNIERFQEAQRSILGKAGCAGCTSGLRLEWRNFEEYYINEKLQATPVLNERTVGFGA